MDTNFGTLIPSNFVHWLLHIFNMLQYWYKLFNLDGENISRTTCWTDEFETINKPKPWCRFHRWCPWCRFHRRYKSLFFWLEGFRIKASSKSIINQIQQFMNVDENGSVANAFVQNMAFFLSGKVKMTIREAGQSLKSTTLTSHITWQVLVLALSHDLNNWTRLCWGESMWPEHKPKLVLSSWWMRHCSTSWCRSSGQMLWPSRIWDEHLHVFKWILPDLIR